MNDHSATIANYGNHSNGGLPYREGLAGVSGGVVAKDSPEAQPGTLTALVILGDQLRAARLDLNDAVTTFLIGMPAAMPEEPKAPTADRIEALHFHIHYEIARLRDLADVIRQRS